MDSGAVSPLDDARQSAPGAVRGRQLYRRRARLRRMPHRASRLAARRPPRLSPRRVSATTLSHLELVVVEVREHELRPRFVCRVAHRASHAPFQGFNRAQAAVIEGAVLVSRLASPASRRSRGGARAPRNHRRQDGRTGGGRSLELAQGQGGAGLRRLAQLGGRACRPSQSLTSWAARSFRARMGDRASYRPLESAALADQRPGGRRARPARASIHFRRFMSPISTRSSATGTISPRCAAFAQSSQHCKCGSTTARRTPPRSRRSSAPISARRSSAANRNATASSIAQHRGLEAASCSRSIFAATRFKALQEILAEPALWPQRVIVMTLARVGSGAGPDLQRLACDPIDRRRA